MNDNTRRFWLIAIGLATAAGLFVGWRLFWFLTDDAFIAFRYVSNSIAGNGYVWNPPPFKAVEGYTSFLWVALLDGSWRLTGIEPPAIANYFTLFFSGLTLLLTGQVVWKMELREPLGRVRVLLLAIVFLGILTNRTFLAWTSSGLETAMFNFFLSAWIVLGWRGQLEKPLRMAALTATASLVYLTRPDGLLVLIGTGLLVIATVLRANRGWKPSTPFWAALAPLLAPVLHLAWRLATYGEWLPNTFYAKHVDAWPEAGLRYLASFILEYGLIVWLAILALVLIRLRKSDLLGEGNETVLTGFFDHFGPWVVAGVVAGQIGYYTLIIGGDHFEYRVYSYLIPWIMISFLWMVNRLTRDWVTAAAVCGLLLVASWPLPWVHWALSKDLVTRDETHVMLVPVAEEFPTGLRWYARAFDDLQFWLIEHHVCMRHQEHKIFQSWFASQFPTRSYEMIPQAGEFPTMSYGSIGVPGWVFPRVAIIDQFGLNDYVIARNPIRPSNERKMAHDRFPPRGYWQSWAINYGFLEDGSTGFVKRDYELTAEDIVNSEHFWIDRVVNGRDEPMPYDMLCRIGETNNRMGSYDTALISLVPAVRMEPKTARGLVGLAQSMSGLGRVDSARALLEDAVSIEPDNPLILSRLGVAVADQAYPLYRDNRPLAEERFTLSMSYLNQALARDRCWSEALTELASIFIFRDQPDSSYAYLDRLEDCPASSPKLAQLLGERYLRKQAHLAAMRSFALAIKNGLNINQKRYLLKKYPELGAMVGE